MTFSTTSHHQVNDINQFYSNSYSIHHNAIHLYVYTFIRLYTTVIPFGGGTSIEGQTLAVRGGVSLDFSHMKSIVALRPNDLDITLQAGVGYVELNEMLRPHGLWFPLDPG